MAEGVVGGVSISVLPDTDRFDIRDDVKRMEAYYRRNPVNIRAKITELESASLKEISRVRREVQQRLDAETARVPLRMTVRKLSVTRPALQDARRDVERYFKEHPVQVYLDTAKANIERVRRKVERELDSIKLGISPLVDRKMLEKASHLLDEAADDRDATINADADTGHARAKLAWLTRPRTVHIGTAFVDTGRVAQQLAAVSGLAAVDRLAGRIRDTFLDFDQVALRVQKWTFGFLALSNVVGAAAAGVVNFGAGLAKASKVGLLLPAVLQSVALGFTAIKWAKDDAERALKDVYDKFKKIEKLTTDTFWSKAKKPIQSFVNNSFGMLKTGFVDIGRQLGHVTSSVMAELEKLAKNKVIKNVFDQTATAIRRSTIGVTDLTAAFIELGSHGANWLPRLASWANDVARRFRDWVDASAKAGKIDRWIEQGVGGMRTLGSAVKETSRVFVGLYKAVNSAGTGMSGFVSIMRSMADAVNTKRFQLVTEELLKGARGGVKGLVAGAKDFARAIGDASQVFSRMFETAGVQFGRILSAFGEALYSPQLRAGLLALSEGFKKFTDSIVYVVPVVTPAIGSLAKAIAHVASTVGTQLAGALTIAAPLIKGFADLIAAIPSPLIAGGAAMVLFFGQLQKLSALASTVTRTFATVKNALGAFIAQAQTGTLSLGASGLSGALKSLKAGIAGLAVGGIIAGFTAWTQQAEAARQKTRTLAHTLDEFGRVTARTRETIYENLGKDVNWGGLGSSLTDRIEKLGLSIHSVVDALMDADPSKINQIIQGLRDTADAMRANPAERGMAQEVDDVANALEKQVGSMRDARAENERYRNVMNEAEGAAKKAADAALAHADAIKRQMRAQEAANSLFSKAANAQLAARDAQRRYNDTLGESTKIIANSSKAYEVRESALDDIARATWDLVHAQDKAGVKQSELDKIMRAGRETFIQQAKVLLGNKKAATELADSLGLIPGEYKANVSADTGLALARIGELKIAIDETSGTVLINGQPAKGQEALRRFADEIDKTTGIVTIGGNRFPADATVSDLMKYILGAYGEVKIGANTVEANSALNTVLRAIRDGKDNVTIGGWTGPATDALKMLLAEINSKSAKVIVGVNDRTPPEVQRIIRHINAQVATIQVGANLRGTTMADGGILRFADGGVTRFANGGRREHHVAQIARAGEWRVWAEDETGGEAYIPMAKSKRARSTQILRAVAHQFGYSLEEYADGSEHGMSGGRGGDVYNVNVTMRGDTLRDVASLAHFVDMLNVRKRMERGL